jgi:DNA-binding GntR family transcriptional regulator
MAAISRIACAPYLTEQVYQRLLHAICDGELAPGARLTQEELAISRQPVLQALRLLKKDGFVIDAGRRGLRVAPLEAQAIAHMYDIRAVLDGLAARRAAERLARHHGERAGHNLVAQLTRHARTLPEHPAAQEETP